MFHEIKNSEDLSEDNAAIIRSRYKLKEKRYNRTASINEKSQETVATKDIQIETNTVIDENLLTEINSYFKGLFEIDF